MASVYDYIYFKLQYLGHFKLILYKMSEWTAIVNSFEVQ